MKWATPAWSGVSRREPASTYAAMLTDRALASGALMTRGPSGNAVRSNIAGMVQEGRDRSGPWRARRASDAPGSAGRRGRGPGSDGAPVRHRQAPIAATGQVPHFTIVWIHSLAKYTTKAMLTAYISGFTAAALPQTTWITSHETRPGRCRP